MWGNPEAATRGVLCKKVLLEISQNLQENICARVSVLIKLHASGLHSSNPTLLNRLKKILRKDN